MQTFYLKLISGFVILFLVSVIGYDYYEKNYKPLFTRPISEYYEIISNQEKVLENEKLTEVQSKELEGCYKRDDFRCFLEYFEKFTLENNLRTVFSHLSYLMQVKPEYKVYCHQMAHGIGHGELRKATNNGANGQEKLGEILQDFSMNQYFKNIRSCGSGFFHGLVEELVVGTSDKDKLVNIFKDICGKDEYKNVLKGDCIHGLGHASYLQLEYDLDNSLYVCDRVTSTVYDKFNCYTGVFMEANLDLAQSDVIVKENNFYRFPMCDKLSDELQRRACFFESVLQFKHFTGVPALQVSYADMIPLCRNFQNDLYRLICIRNISIRSVSENAETNLQKMCIDNVGTRAERVMCVAGFAHKLVMSITSEEKTPEYFKYTTEICNYLGRKDASACEDIIKNSPQKLYIVDEKDLLLNK